MADVVCDTSNDASARKDSLPLGHRVRYALSKLRQRICAEGKQAARLGLWLEEDVFPRMKRSGCETIHLDILATGEIRLVESKGLHAALSLHDAGQLCDLLRHAAIHRLQLDTRLESNQIEDVLALLSTYHRSLAAGHDGRETSNGIVGQLRSQDGLHFCCARLRLQGHVLAVEYSYCVTRLSLAVRWFEGRHRHFNDHRALFRAAPRYGALAAALTVGILLVHLLTDSLPLLIGMMLLQAAIFFGAVYVFLRGMGSIEYDNEEANYRLSQAHAGLKQYADRIRRDLDLAETVQQKLLPDEAEMPRADLLRWASHFTPQAEVGGDYFDAADLGEQRVAMVFADVSGHGTAAALITVIVKMAFRTWIEARFSLTDFVRRVNRDLCRLTPEGSFVVMIAAIYDHPKGNLNFVNCGHAPGPFVMSADPSRPIACITEPGAMLLGVDEEIEVTEATQSLVPGDRVLLATDGLTEAADSQGGLYGKDRLREFLQANGTMNLEELVSALTEDVARFSAETEQNDDRTVLAFEAC